MIHDVDEIERLFRQNYSAMYRVASMILHDGESAHDAVHDVFANIMDIRSDLSSIDSAYLLRAVKNTCLNSLRKIEIHKRFAELYPSETIAASDETWPDNDTLQLMEGIISLLPPKCYEVFNLRFKEGMKSSMISEKLGISERAVYKHLSHALKFLRTKLSANGKN